jgi:class 3 adenylate cyclase/tetratricopeptide (TPR) repeat protein
VTVLFADVVGFTPLSERFDPEIVHEMMDGCLALLAREVERYGGRVNAFTGDGVMALFGAPLAEEDHAIRALHAALAIQEHVPRYSEDVQRRFGAEFLMRIGVNSGLVLAGGMGEGTSVEYTALGDTINLAARLESAATPGGVLAGESTYRAAGEAFSWQPVGPLTLKGKSEPVVAYEPIAASEGQSRFEALAQRGLTSFVGRRAEFDALLRAWERAAAGHGQIVSVVGEAGLGKSRLLHEFKTEMAKREAPLFEGSCFTYGEAISYLPFLEIVRQVVGIDPTVPADEASALLDGHLSRRALGPESAPYLHHLLGHDPGGDLLARQSAAVIRQRTLDAVRDLILAEAAEDALALVVEDVHWIDKASEDLLSVLVESISEAPVLLLLVYRPEYLRAWGDVAYHAEVNLSRLGGVNSAAMVRAILNKSYAQRVSLERLSDEDSQAMIRQLLGTATIPVELERLVESHADGNPLFIEELIRDLVESGHLVRDGGGYALTRHAEEINLPTTVGGLFLARADRLEPELRNLLQVASVLGRVFNFSLLGAVAGLQRDELERALLQLEDVDFVYQSALAPERQYSFKHVLAQEAIYQTLVRSRREAHHAAAGRAIEALYSDRLDEWIEILAHHYTRSGDDAKALAYLELAHDKASRDYAHAEAKGFFEEAMRILDRAPDTPEHRTQRVRFLADEFIVHFLLYEIPAYFELATRHREVADSIDDLGLRGLFYEKLGHSQWILGRLVESLDTTQRAAEMCEAGGNTSGAGQAYTNLESVHLGLGNYAEVGAWKHKALRAFERDYDPFHYMLARTMSAWAHIHRGAWTDAIEECKEALRAGQEHDDPGIISIAAFFLCYAYIGEGRYEEAQSSAELALQKAPTLAEIAWSKMFRAGVWCRMGQAERAVETLLPLGPLCDASQMAIAQIFNACFLGEAYCRTGRLKEAAETLDGTIEHTERIGWPYYLGSALRLRAEVVRKADSSEQGRRRAAGYFERAMGVLSEIGAENELALAQAGYARLCREGGDRDTARRYYRTALETLERLGSLAEPPVIRKALADLNEVAS